MRIAILTGSGISAESGIRTFRNGDGLWNEHSINDVATFEGFVRNPDMVRNFYNERHAEYAKAKPNAAHDAIARLQKSDMHEVLLITQNIDDLHERAGSTNVKHMHGDLKTMLCSSCNEVSFSSGQIDGKTQCPECYSSTIRPNVVWFGEIPHYLEEIDTFIRNCDIFAGIGTSGIVYPAANFARIAKKKKARTVELNLETTYNWDYKEWIVGPATEIVPVWVDELLQPE